MHGHGLRPFNCFGYPLMQENDYWELVLNEFIRDAFGSGRIIIWEDYVGTRNHLPITELNRILIKIVGITFFHFRDDKYFCRLWSI